MYKKRFKKMMMQHFSRTWWLMANRKNPVQSSEDNGQFVKKRHPNTGEKNTCGIFFGYFQCYLMLLAAKVRHNDIYMLKPQYKKETMSH